jgi:hypothetical protein
MLTAAIALLFGLISGFFVGLVGLIIGLVAAIGVVVTGGILNGSSVLRILLEAGGLCVALQIGYALGLGAQAAWGTRGGVGSAAGAREGERVAKEPQPGRGSPGEAYRRQAQHLKEPPAAGP